MDPENDRQISEHVLRMHRYRAPGEQDGEGVVHVEILCHMFTFIIHILLYITYSCII